MAINPGVSGSQDPGLWIWKFWIQGPGSFVLGPHFRLCQKKKGKTRKSLCLTIPKLSISSSYFFLKRHSLYILCFDTLTNNLIHILVFLDETSEGMFLLYLLELAETAYLKVYGNYLEELFHVKKLSCSKDFRRSMVEALQIYVCIMRK